MSDPRPHLGFESENQLKAFIRALSGAAIPGKFAYVGEAAANYNTHALTREYRQITRSVAEESALLSEVWDQELNSAGTLVDVGPGNGLHSAALLQRLLPAVGWLPSEYLAIDYSFHMAEIAKRNIAMTSGWQTSRSTVAPNLTKMETSISRLCGAGRSEGSRIRAARLAMHARRIARLLGKFA